MKNVFSFLIFVFGALAGWVLNDALSVSDQKNPESVDALVGTTSNPTKLNDSTGIAAGGSVENKTTLSFDERLEVLKRIKGTPSIKKITAALQIISNLSEEELRETIDSMLGDDTTMMSMGDYILPYYLFTALSEKNPADALEMATSNKNQQLRAMYTSALFATWSVSDPDAALAAIEQLEDARLKQTAMYTVISALASTNPKRAFAVLQNSKDTTSRWLYRTMFQSWAMKDSSGARTAILNMQLGEERNMAWGGYFAALIQNDSASAIQEILSMQNQSEQLSILQTVTAELFQGDIDAGFLAISQLPEGVLRDKMIRSALYMAASIDPEKTIEWALANTQGELQDRPP